MQDPNQTQAIPVLSATRERAEQRQPVLGKLVKTLPTYKTLLAAEPTVQAAFVRHVVETFRKLGARKAKPGANVWFRNTATPLGAGEAAGLLLRRRLPFFDEMFAEMLEQISCMDFVTFAPTVKQLVAQLEKRAGESQLSARTREAAARVADGLLAKGWPKAVAENWGIPRPQDQRLVERIQQVVASG